jgi:uncharacterized tellurite resistance protein B-like protein
MERIDILTEEFKVKYEKFLIGCDAVEEADVWNKQVLGEMDVFYENDLISIIIRLIVADGEISEKEAEYINRNFGFDYTVDFLKEVYENCREEIGDSFDEKFKSGVFYMKKVNEKLAAAYEELLGIVCDIVIESDGEISQAEIEEAKRIKALI